jgi:tetratricopeptide (TPR) repeat protein
MILLGVPILFIYIHRWQVSIILGSVSTISSYIYIIYLIEKEWILLDFELKLISFFSEECGVDLSGEATLYVDIMSHLIYCRQHSIWEDFAVKTWVLDLESNIVGLGLPMRRWREEDRLGKVVHYYFYMKNFDKADKVINTLLGFNPHSIMGLILLAGLYENMDEIDKAFEAIEKACEEFIAQNSDLYKPLRYVDSQITRLTILKNLRKRGKPD